MRNTRTADWRVSEWAAQQAEGKRRRRDERAARRTVILAAVNLALATVAWTMARRARQEGEAGR